MLKLISLFLLGLVSSSESLTILIASHRDIFCHSTVHNIYLRAKKPKRVFVNIVQEIYSEDFDCFSEIFNNPQISQDLKNWLQTNVSVFNKPPSKDQGLHVSVYQAQQMISPENRDGFVMKIDSHSDFLIDYDQKLFDLFRKIGDENAVLSSYPLGYEDVSDYNDQSKNEKSRFKSFGKVCRIKKNKSDLFFMPISIVSNLDTYKCFQEKGFCRGLFVVGGFIFTKVNTMEKVPYDKYLSYFFNGEQILYSLRLFTHGYNVYIPKENFIFHLYAKNRKQRIRYHMNKPHDQSIYDKSLNRYKYIFGLIEKNNVSLNKIEMGEIESFGLGNKKSLEDFYKTIGVDFREYLFQNKRSENEFDDPCRKLDIMNAN